MPKETGKDEKPANLLGMLKDAEKDTQGINWGTVNQLLLKANVLAGMLLGNRNAPKK